MSRIDRFFVFVLAVGLASAAVVRGDDKAPQPATGCAAAVDNYFEDEVWAKVGVQTCLTCHRKGGDAEDSKFVLLDPRKSEGAARDEAMRHNRARLRPHGGGQGEGPVADAPQGRRRARPRRRRRAQARLGRVPHPRRLRPPGERPGRPASAGRRGGSRRRPPFFDGVVMLDDRRLLRRVTLSLAGRLPTDAELAAVAKDGLQGDARDPRRGHEGGRLLRPAPRGVQRHLPDARRRRERGPDGACPTSTSRRPGTGIRSTT